MRDRGIEEAARFAVDFVKVAVPVVGVAWCALWVMGTGTVPDLPQPSSGVEVEVPPERVAPPQAPGPEAFQIQRRQGYVVLSKRGRGVWTGHLIPKCLGHPKDVGEACGYPEPKEGE
jgi:hypothetical protein